ncbi:MAG: NAD(P)-binding domain-containing protein [Bifidobacterium minimum]|jgi:D-lactate dehydrogenase|nr:NAD(P)-binding domain-containing protein [Bifidobacterium minimum]
MTSIAFYYPLDEEKAVADAWSREHGIRVDCNRADLGLDTLDFARGHDAVCYRQRVPLDSTRRLYRLLPKLGVHHIALRSAGLDTVDLAAAHANGLRVTNVPSYSPPAVAELVLAHVMRLIRHTPQFADRASHNDYIVTGLMSRELSEITIGIIGVGRIGSRVARIFHTLGATVLGNDIVGHPELERQGVLTYVSKDELLAKSDVVTLHVYLDATTRHLIDADALRRIRPSAYLVNASRGPVVDTDALIAALESGGLAGAALDVVEGEATLFNKSYDGPIPDARYRRLQAMSNVTLTPHVGFFTDIAVHNMVYEALDDALTISSGGESSHEIGFD